jgi:hypothetical protein
VKAAPLLLLLPFAFLLSPAAPGRASEAPSEPGLAPRPRLRRSFALPNLHSRKTAFRICYPLLCFD